MILSCSQISAKSKSKSLILLKLSKYTTNERRLSVIEIHIICTMACTRTVLYRPHKTGKETSESEAKSNLQSKPAHNWQIIPRWILQGSFHCLLVDRKLAPQLGSEMEMQLKFCNSAPAQSSSRCHWTRRLNTWSWKALVVILLLTSD